jgi:putative membrane protein insertion efficiency factor
MNFFIQILINLIKGYRYLASPLLGHSCRYLPTCSEYSIEALQTFGFFKGIYMSIKRILSCHPIKFLGSGGGFDPIRKKISIKK